MDLPIEYNGLVDMVRQFLMEFVQDPKCENIEVSLSLTGHSDTDSVRLRPSLGNSLTSLLIDGLINMEYSYFLVLEPGNWYRFESDLSQSQHAHYNTLFNGQLNQSAASWKYQHLRTFDYVLQFKGRKIRITKDAATGRIIEAMHKVRLADLAIHLPRSHCDIRLSINQEEPIPVADFEDGRLDHMVVDVERYKDRLSYSLLDRQVKFDLTLVKQMVVATQQKETKYELEAEHLDARQLINDPASFVALILSLPTFP